MGSGLGTPKRYFPIKNRFRVGSLVAFFCLLGCSVAVFLEGLSVTYLAYQKHGPVMIEDALTVPGLAAIGLFLAGLAAGGWALLNWNKGVVVYEHGFAVHDHKGRQLWRWEEIVSLTGAVTRPLSGGNSTGARHVYTLINRQKQHLVLNNAISRVDELALLIQEAITPNLYDQARQQFNSGQRLVFGLVTISKAGMEVGKKPYAWEEVRQVSIKRGILKVSKKEGNWFSEATVLLSSIPNLNILLNIIHQVVGLQIG
jgi:hypothetical protein